MSTKFDIEVKWVDDENPDLSWLGEYKSNRPDIAYVDRKNDIVVSPSRYVTEKFENIADAEDRFNYLEDELEIACDLNEDDFSVTHPALKELPFSCRYGRNDYRFVETCNYPDGNDDELDYIIQDVKQLEDYNDGDWYMRGCIVTASINGIKLGDASLWGLDSTMTEEEDNEVISDLTWQAEQEALNKLSILQNVEIESE